MAEPVGVNPGVYTIGNEQVMGLCFAIDDKDAGWNVIEESDGSIVVTIPKGSPWKVKRTLDKADPYSHYLQVFRKDGNLNAIVLENFIHPTDEVHTPNADHPKDEPPRLKIFYTNPEKTTGYPVVGTEIAQDEMPVYP